MRRLLVALFFVVAGCSAAPSAAPSVAPTPLTHDITGTFTLTSTDVANLPGQNNCYGTAGYADVVVGMPVVVKDQAGTIIATGTTGFQSGEVGQCVLSISVPKVPDVPFYSVEVGHRGAITYSNADFAAKGWRVDLTLGS